MTAAVRKHPQVLWAEELFERLHAGFLDIESTLRTIIASEAWIPLGYRTFGDAWAARMSDITLAVELRPHVVYQLLEERVPVDKIAEAVKGVSTETVELLDEQKAHGVPADMATTTVRRHTRKLPSGRKFVHLQVDSDTHREWRRKAREHNTTINTVALAAITAAFETL